MWETIVEADSCQQISAENPASQKIYSLQLTNTPFKQRKRSIFGLERVFGRNVTPQSFFFKCQSEYTAKKTKSDQVFFVKLLVELF